MDVILRSCLLYVGITPAVLINCVLFCIQGATNTLTGEMLNVERAAALNILDPVSGTFTDLRTKAKMLIGDAVDQNLVLIEYDTKASGTDYSDYH